MAMGRMPVVYSHAAHHGVERPQPTGVVGDEQRPALARHVVDADDLCPEPALQQRPERGQHHLVGQVGVEAELVDLVVAGQPATQECESRGDATLQSG